MSDRAAATIDQAFAALRQGQPDQAERLLQQLLRKKPRHFDALFLFGALRSQQGRFTDAVTLFERAVKARPDNADAHYNLGLALARLGSRDRALECYRSAVATNPFHINAYNNLGAELLARECWDEAIACIKQALAFHPGNPQLHSNLGVALKELGRVDEAISSLQTAVAGQPRNAAVHANLGLALRQAGRLDEAIVSFRNALTLDARFADYHNQLGLALAETGELDAAVDNLRAAIRLSPERTDIHGNLGMVLLLTGNLREGWAEYRFRGSLGRDKAEAPQIDAPPWRGEPLAGKSILVHAEQGLGDTLQFIRYLPPLADMGAAVTFEVQPILIPILRNLAKTIDIVPRHDGQAQFDYQSPLLSLPHWLGTELTNIPSETPYLSVDEARIARWRERIDGEGLKLGIAWQGTPTFVGDRGRSIPLGVFAPFAEIPGVRLISLQKHPGAEQIAIVPFAARIETPLDPDDLSPDALLDTAAVMMNCDLVVSSCTMTAHLAGALARPLYVALRRVPDWRWLMEREDSPWYPTARLFRQQREGDWGDVFARIAAAVRTLTRAA